MRFFGRRKREELEEEIQGHLRMAAQEQMERGESASRAQQAARREFGNVDLVREITREAWGWRWLEDLLQDIRYGLRTLRKGPGFMVVAILTLALGIGANTAIFSVINSVLLQPLPFHDPNHLVRVFSARETPVNLPVSGEDYFDWRARNRSFESTTLYSSPRNFNASGVGEPETVSVVSAESNFFSVLGVRPQGGRAFAAGEDGLGKNHVALLSYGFSQRHFGSVQEAIGKTVRLDFEAYTVVGVMPLTFNYPESVDLWIPLEMSIDRLGRRGNYSYRVLARLKPGVTIAQAQADMSRVTKQLEAEHPITNTNLGARVVLFKELLTGDSRPQLLVLLGAVALVLLVACPNVANLLLARAAGRQREMALRAALGASRWRLVRQLLTESVMLSCSGAGLGLAGAWWLVAMAQKARTLPIPRENPIQVDAAVLLYTAGISIVVGILFGLAPALEASRLNLNEELKSSADAVAGVTGWKLALRNALVAGQIATSLALLVGAGLLLRSFARMRSADIGVRTQKILTAAVVLPDTKYKKISDRRAFYEHLLERVERVPGVEAAAISQQIPLEGSHGGMAKLPGDTDPLNNGLPVNWNFVTPSYFRVFGISFLSGREFSTQEIERAAEVGESVDAYWEAGGEVLRDPQPQWSTFAIINRTMAQTLWPHQDAVGKVFISSIVQPVTVAGVVADEKYSDIREPATAEVYFPFTEELTNKWYPPNIVARSTGIPESVLGGIRTAVHDLDGELSLFRVRSMEQVLSEKMQDTTLQTVLLGAFAALALVLSAVGIYGVMAYLVSQRTHEIGLRIALGAQRSDILQLILGRGARVTAMGVVLGAVAALALTRVMRRLLFGVSPTDAATFAAVVVVLTIVALLACYLPARRAMRVDPMAALRYE